MSLVIPESPSDPDAAIKLGAGSAAYQTQPWYDAYMAALFAAGSAEIVERIRLAERLMLAREREIHTMTSEIAERGALDRAFNALRALQLCQKLHP